MAPYSGPEPSAVNEALKKLVRYPADPEWVLAHGDELLRLKVVLDALGADYDEDNQGDPASDPIVDQVFVVIDEGISKIGSRPYRRLLRQVFGRDPASRTWSVGRRRTEAGRQWSTRGVGGDTIRVFHEPKAINQLTITVIKIEAGHRKEEPPDLSRYSKPKGR